MYVGSIVSQVIQKFGLFDREPTFAYLPPTVIPPSLATPVQPKLTEYINAEVEDDYDKVVSLFSESWELKTTVVELSPNSSLPSVMCLRFERAHQGSSTKVLEILMNHLAICPLLTAIAKSWVKANPFPDIATTTPDKVEKSFTTTTEVFQKNCRRLDYLLLVTAWIDLLNAFSKVFDFGRVFFIHTTRHLLIHLLNPLRKSYVIDTLTQIDAHDVANPFIFYKTQEATAIADFVKPVKVLLHIAHKEIEKNTASKSSVEGQVAFVHQVLQSHFLER
jgi:hypothetical protein